MAVMTKYLLLSIAMLAASTAPAHAYLDPGTGSMILQAIATAGIGAMLYFAWFWRKIKSFFGGDATAKNAEPETTEIHKD
ncbi:MAG: hypothetical protein O2967_21920 [Proteobacteria bacterium]|nr:hypothetical protein [Pseudomonadota bacterium]